MSRALHEIERLGASKLGYIGQRAYTVHKLTPWVKHAHLREIPFFRAASEAPTWALQDLSQHSTHNKEEQCQAY